MIRHDDDPLSGHQLHTAFAPDFKTLAELQLPSSRTILLIAADATGVPAETIGLTAERLLASGLCYVCTWGPDCERVHDIFDEIHVGDGSRDSDTEFMSTWHDAESLDDALWFFLHNATIPAGSTDFVAAVAVSIGNRECYAEIERALSDPSTFVKRCLGED